MTGFLGFDTSNYTTSVAAVAGETILSERRILDVKPGMRGLRQSDAGFLHMRNMPDLYDNIFEKLGNCRIKGVGASTKPRNVEGSYMPVFLTGYGYARAVARTLGVPLFEFSHQDGHIMSGIVSEKRYDLLEKEFLSVHLSGGTTEILKSVYNGYSFDNTIVGGTKDISAGQLTDRVGVSLGLRFPCGKEMEALCENKSKRIKLKVCVDGGYVNFSGAETAILRSDESVETKAFSVFLHVAEALCEMLNNVIKTEKISDVLIVGGVASNAIIRNYLNENVNGSIYYASPEYSTDNAVGIAALARKGGE